MSSKSREDIIASFPLVEYCRKQGWLVRREGTKHKTLCPWHDDHHPSLTLYPAPDEHCHCESCGKHGTVIDLHMQVKGLENGKAAMEDLSGEPFASNGHISSNGKREACRYTYQDEHGSPLRVIVRYEPKAFRQCRPDGTWNVEDLPHVPYHLPEVLASQEVWVTEGEKDADNIMACGLCATTNDGGAGNWQAECNRYLEGKDVIIVPDNDEAGRKRVSTLREMLTDITASLRVVTIPAKFKDISALLGANEDKRQALSQLRDSAKLLGLPPMESCLAFSNEHIEMPPEIIEGVLHQGSKVMIGGASKSYKTWIMLDLAISVASGTSWLECDTIKSKVLYVNFEIGRPHMQKRVRTLCSAMQVQAPENLMFWNLRGHGTSADVILPRIASKAKEGFRLIVIDPMYKLLGSNDENSAHDILKVMNAVERLAIDTGAAVCYGSHYAKGNAADKDSIDRVSGSGVFARDPDSIITFTPHTSQGCYTVEMHLRNCDQVMPFVVRWEYPRMVIEPQADPADLRRNKSSGGRPRQWTPEKILAHLTRPMTTMEWYEEICTKVQEEGLTPPSKQTFFSVKDEAFNARLVRWDHIDKKYTAR
jgi:5S rRNA maturation endonuclease (ribonuclease M5)